MDARQDAPAHWNNGWCQQLEQWAFLALPARHACAQAPAAPEIKGETGIFRRLEKV